MTRLQAICEARQITVRLLRTVKFSPALPIAHPSADDRLMILEELEQLAILIDPNLTEAEREQALAVYR